VVKELAHVEGRNIKVGRHVVHGPSLEVKLAKRIATPWAQPRERLSNGKAHFDGIREGTSVAFVVDFNLNGFTKQGPLAVALP